MIVVAVSTGLEDAIAVLTDVALSARADAIAVQNCKMAIIGKSDRWVAIGLGGIVEIIKDKHAHNRRQSLRAPKNRSIMTQAITITTRPPTSLILHCFASTRAANQLEII